MLSRPTTAVTALVPVLLVAFATASPALASPFPNPDGTDSMDASPIERGKSTLDLRVDGSLPTSGVSQGQGLFNVNYFGGLIDGVELGGGVNANAPLGALAGVAPIDQTYLYGRVNLPGIGDDVRLALAAGSTLPVGGSDVQPGVLGIGNWAMGDFTLGVNTGYGFNLTQGQGLVTGNLNGAWDVAGVTLMEEQHVDWPLGAAPSGGVRVAMLAPFWGRYQFDVNLAATFQGSPTGTDWAFNPNVGMMAFF